MDKRLFYLLNKARQRVYKVADQRCEDDLDVSVTQLGALLAIAHNDGCQLKDMARELSLNNSAVTGLAGRMEQRGLLERRACEHDGRSSRLYLTAQGRDTVDRAWPLIQTLNQRMTEGFTDEEINVILRFLNRLVDEF